MATATGRRNLPLARRHGPRCRSIMALHDFHMKGMASDYDVHVGREVAMVLTGGDTDVTEELTERDLLKLEQKHFVALTKQPKTLARLEHMLSTNKPLRN